MRQVLASRQLIFVPERKNTKYKMLWKRINITVGRRRKFTKYQIKNYNKLKILNTMKTYLILFSCLCVAILSAQKKELISFPTSAEAYSISKVEKMPMDYFRGKANINIPIYTITIDGISIPISLSYNTGGIKLNEVSSIVGLGWSLNIPGSIQHEIKGQNDFFYNTLSKDINDYPKYRGITLTAKTDLENHKKAEDLEAILGNAYDTKPDIFNFSLPSVSGAFILQNNNAGSFILKQDNLKGFTIPNEDIIITKNNGKFYLTDQQGNEYWMSSKNMVESYYNYKTTMNSTLYNTDSIKINNKLVKFTYNKNNLYKEQNTVEIANLKYSTDPSGSYYKLPPLIKYEKKPSYTISNENLINKIVFDKGEVIFLYSDDEGMSFPDGAKYRKDLEGNKGVALRRVLVKNNSGSVIKDIILNYRYFDNNNTEKNNEDYRLKLVSIHDNLQNNDYKFTYNEEFNFPRRNSNNDDYWGYVNSLGGDKGTGIPLNYTNNSNIQIPGVDFGSLSRRDREPVEKYAQIGSLKSIQYPTGATKNFYYELPFINKSNTGGKTIAYYANDRMELAGIYSSPSEPGGRKDFVLDDSVYQKLYNINKEAEIGNVNLNFTNFCDNATLPNNQLPPEGSTRCTGSASYGTNRFSGGQPKSIEWPRNSTSGSISLFKQGNCQCNISVSLNYKYPVYTESPDNNKTTYSGLRITKIEDIDQNNISNVYTYLYGKYDQNKTFVPMIKLNQPYNFSKITQRHIKGVPIDDYQTPEGFIEQYLTLQNSTQNSNAYGSSDIASYPYVIEKNGKGSVLMEFSEGDLPQLGYNRWKAGRLKKETYVNAADEIIKTVDYIEKLNPIKNSLSGFNIDSNIPYMAAFYTNFDILPIELAYKTVLEINAIESAKIENFQTITKEFLGNKVIETVTTNNYYDTNINTPINVQNSITKNSDGSSSETSYQYAHEKGNQKLINANMIGIPLHTTTTKDGKVIANVETKYDDPANLLPTSVLSYDLQNPAVSKTELTYDLYDNKGNILQYSEKGKPVTIIWGYGQTQPIAKIEGATYNQISAYVSAIIAASEIDNTQGTDQSEQALISALDAFRNNTALSGYQISTYSYNPLIGVTSITPPSGIREVYKYDAANRLESVKDVNGNILKEYQYRYKN
ncbi:RHS repeat domain-containing protein [Elizabethkingia meningoseptica]|uniref:RHS repeat domain-containing protein n=1 Tax=Elizabethkingia meningoseptica TaxID=238 RepID=UPI0023AF12CA|nr:RHS repeat domain-containing protein [Elizabethkingia meningoseptica]MDE5494215.1 RHS repeat protein [Elizabethkingia meningoseptica]